MESVATKHRRGRHIQVSKAEFRRRRAHNTHLLLVAWRALVHDAQPSVTGSSHNR
jgi:hypothetical protein